MYIDRRRLEQLMRRALDRLNELELALWEEMSEAMRELEEELDSRYYRLANGVMDPLYTILDRGRELVILVDLPGSDPSTITVEAGRDRIRVAAGLREEVVARAMHGVWWSSRTSRYEGVIRLPAPIDPSTVRVERRGSTLVITAVKEG